MAFTSYASSLRGDRGPLDRGGSIEQGVPFFVPQLSKVKTNVTCQSTNQHLLFCFEKPASTTPSTSDTTSTTSSTTTTTSSASGSYRKQGNQDLYSTENLRKRQLLLDDPLVLAAIARFWETFPHIRQGHATSLDKRDYVDVFIKFFKALVAPSEFSMAEAKRIVERDWQRDAGFTTTSSSSTNSTTSSTGTMTLPLFNKALFEVADIWTVGIGPEIYASFLQKLYDRVTMRVYDQDKCVWLTVFADLDKIRPFGAVESKGSSPSAASSGVEEETNSTNQDHEGAEVISSSSSSSFVSSSVGSSSSSGGGGGAAAATATATSKTVSKPPLLKKKMLSVPNGLGSPTNTKSNNALLGMLSTAETMGGSMRRLPDLQTPQAVGSSSSTLGIASRGGAPPSPPPPSHSGWMEASASSSRSDGGAPLESPESAPPASRKAPTSTTGSNSPTGGGNASPSRTSTTSTKMIQRSASLRREQLNPTNKRRDNITKTEASSSSPTSDDVSAPESIPPQQVRLSMPSIYLSPEITPSNTAEKAARRRIRESMKLAQRLRRITF